jgi:hypothetical protein
MKALFLSLLLCYSCSKYAEVSKDAVGIHLSPIQMEVSHLNEIEWQVGKKRESEVSQSLTFIIDLPKIKDSDLEFLKEQKGIDAWIIRLIVNRGSQTQDLGSLYALFKPRKISRGIQNSGSISSVTVKVYYAAAYASERFRAFKCPAFGHRKKISNMQIQGENEDFSLSIGQAQPYNEKSHGVELTPSSFNGGNSLIGTYYLEIAPYDSVKKYTHSSFKRIPMYVTVDREDSIEVKSCAGVHPELEF